MIAHAKVNLADRPVNVMHLSAQTFTTFDKDTDRFYALAYCYFTELVSRASWFFNSVHANDGEWQKEAIARLHFGHSCSVSLGDYGVLVDAQQFKELQAKRAAHDVLREA